MRLEVVGLTKRYGSVVALDDCSFVVPQGRLVGLLGPNGAGKTTSMRSVFGLVRPDAGQVLWDGSPVGEHVWQRFGYLPEERGLYPRMKVRDQVVHFARLGGADLRSAEAAADHWLARVGLTDRASSRTEALSHGNRQRVQLAVALVGDPVLLVLDEPFNGLDPLAVESLGALLRELAVDGVAVLFSSHQLDLVEDLCEDVVTLSAGRVVLAGPLQQLRADSTRRRVDVEFGAVAPGGWWLTLPGASLLSQDDRRVRLLVDRDTTADQALTAARSVAPVAAFRFEPPSLSEMFVEAVRT